MSKQVGESQVLVSGGNVTTSAVNLSKNVLTDSQREQYRLGHTVQNIGLAFLLSALLWLIIYLSYQTWHTSIHTTATMFKATVTAAPVFHFNPVWWGVLFGIGLIATFGGPQLKEAALRSRWSDRLVTVAMMGMISVSMLLISSVISIGLGAVFHWGNQPDYAAVRDKGNAWIANHLNVNQGVSNVDFSSTPYDPMYLQVQVPDGKSYTIYKVYKVTSDGHTLQIAPQ